MREARAASSLSPPNIALVSDLGQTALGMLYLVMELVEGPNLKEIIRSDGPMDVGASCDSRVKWPVRLRRHMRTTSFIAI
jgi:eukaryotic-like serine/threonine-protein kinase